MENKTSDNKDNKYIQIVKFLIMIILTLSLMLFKLAGFAVSWYFVALPFFVFYVLPLFLTVIVIFICMIIAGIKSIK